MKTFVKEAMVVYGPSKMESPARLSGADDVAKFARPIIANRLSENVVAIAADVKLKPQAWCVISTGTTTSCVVSVADVLRFVLLSGAPGFFLVHNHPSGDSTPSTDDYALTRALKVASAAVGLKFHDHVIVTENSRFSFLEGGWE